MEIFPEMSAEMMSPHSSRGIMSVNVESAKMLVYVVDRCETDQNALISTFFSPRVSLIMWSLALSNLNRWSGTLKKADRPHHSLASGIVQARAVSGMLSVSYGI